MIDIDEIQTGDGVPQQHFAGLRFADFDVFPLHDVRPAGFS